MNNANKDVVTTVTNGLGKAVGTVLKAGALILGMGLLGGTIAAVAAVKLAAWGGFAAFGAFLGGGVAGAYGGLFMAKEYIFAKIEKVVGNPDKLKADLEDFAQKMKAVEEMAPTLEKEVGKAFAAANENKQPETVAATTPVVEVKKAPTL